MRKDLAVDLAVAFFYLVGGAIAIMMAFMHSV